MQKISRTCLLPLLLSLLFGLLLGGNKVDVCGHPVKLSTSMSDLRCESFDSRKYKCGKVMLDSVRLNCGQKMTIIFIVVVYLLYERILFTEPL